MSYQVDFTQKRNSTFLVAAAPVDGDHTTARVEDRVQAIAYQNGGAFLAVAQTARCSDEALAAMREAVSRAENQPDLPVVCRLDDIELQQLAAMGLHGVPAARAHEFTTH